MQACSSLLQAVLEQVRLALESMMHIPAAALLCRPLTAM
jgi:hypothetical protein